MRKEDKALLGKALEAAVAGAGRLRLPLSGRTWRGQTGNWAGAGIGSSIDFQDHRPYLPGDDPRYINWQAYARSGNYAMKLYREEVSPQIDLLLDASASMFVEAAKRLRSWELFFFCRESALKAGASLRAFASSGGEVTELRPEQLLRLDVELPDATDGAPVAAAVPWRPGSLRVVISDLLFPGSPRQVLVPLVQARGRGLLLGPYSLAEEQPDWSGNLRLIDCETGKPHLQFVNTDAMARYRRNYSSHFEEWKRECIRHDVIFAQISSGNELLESLLGDPLQSGAIEMAGGV